MPARARELNTSWPTAPLLTVARGELDFAAPQYERDERLRRRWGCSLVRDELRNSSPKLKAIALLVD